MFVSRTLYVNFVNTFARDPHWNKWDTGNCPGGQCPSVIVEILKDDITGYTPCFTPTDEEVCINLVMTKHSGPSCSKLTMLLVNVSLKLWSLNMAYTLICLLKNVSSFCICKSYSHFFSKNTCELDIVLTRTVNIFTTNELVKLTMLQQVGPE